MQQWRKKTDGTRRWKTNECEEEKAEQHDWMEGYKVHPTAPPSAKWCFDDGKRGWPLMPKKRRIYEHHEIWDSGTADSVRPLWEGSNEKGRVDSDGRSDDDWPESKKTQEMMQHIFLDYAQYLSSPLLWLFIPISKYHLLAFQHGLSIVRSRGRARTDCNETLYISNYSTTLEQRPDITAHVYRLRANTWDDEHTTSLIMPYNIHKRPRYACTIGILFRHIYISSIHSLSYSGLSPASRTSSCWDRFEGIIVRYFVIALNAC